MLGLMQNWPLTVDKILDHAKSWHGDREIVSRSVEGPIVRTTYGQVHERAKRVSNALLALGVKPGDRIATLAWNSGRHMEAWYGIMGIGAVCHTLNPRLFPEQLAWIVNDAQDCCVFFDVTFLKLAEALAKQCPSVKRWIAMTDRAHMPESALKLDCYEELLAAQSDRYEWPEFDENTAGSLCYTSGTTGNPKGALFSHRSTLLHSLAVALPDTFGLSAREVVLPVVPMFHANAWGVAYCAPMMGSKLVMPGPKLDGESLFELFEAEGVTFSAGVPTVWLALLQYLDAKKVKPTTLKRVLIGGSCVPPSMIREFEDRYGIEVLHAWGMTELSPLGVVNHAKSKQLALGKAERDAIANKQGRPPFGIDLEIAGSDGAALPHDGKAFGDLMARGHWVVRRYFRDAGGEVLRDGWFPTGDVATIDADGYMQITDRSKDVIKSGGEWISSIEIENHAMAHPAVAEAAVIGVQHPKWDERPLLVVVKREGQEVTAAAMLDFLRPKIAKWWMPDDVVFVASLPHSATGKISKLDLRKQLAGYRLPAPA
jgi:3-(methylthio)propionyl---CoA ligase